MKLILAVLIFALGHVNPSFAGSAIGIPVQSLICSGRLEVGQAKIDLNMFLLKEGIRYHIDGEVVSKKRQFCIIPVFEPEGVRKETGTTAICRNSSSDREYWYESTLSIPTPLKFNFSYEDRFKVGYTWSLELNKDFQSLVVDLMLERSGNIVYFKGTVPCR